MIKFFGHCLYRLHRLFYYFRSNPVTDIVSLLRGGTDVIVHCSAGRGRAGTTAVCVLMQLGMPAADAMAKVRTERPGAGPEAGPQAALVRDFTLALDPQD